MRIILQSNAPWIPTGYGVTAKELLPRWKALGHEVACFAFCGLYGGQLELNGIPMFPLGKEIWGRDKMVFYNQLFKADIYVTFYDVWATPEIASMDLRWVPYAPVDHAPCQDAVTSVLKSAYRVASLSKNGQKLLKDKGIESTPIYIGLDTKIYKPSVNRDACKKEFGFSEKDFVVGVVAMNKGARKNFADMFDIFKKFSEKHSNARMYLHTDPLRPDGMDLMKMAQTFGITDKIVLSEVNALEMGFSPEKMANLYSAFDVTLMTTGGEGFGQPITESQACGTPVITNDFTTGRELNAIEEFVIKPDRLVMDALMAYQAMTDVDKVVDVLEKIYLEGKEKYSDKCVEFSQKFDWDVVIKDWDVFFKEIEKDLGLTKKK